MTTPGWEYIDRQLVIPRDDKRVLLANGDVIEERDEE